MDVIAPNCGRVKARHQTGLQFASSTACSTVVVVVAQNVPRDKSFLSLVGQPVNAGSVRRRG